MSKQIVPTTKEHILELAETMRQADIDEIWASSHKTPLSALTDSVALSPEPFTGLMDGKVVCIFGVYQLSILDDAGVPWLLGSDLVKKASYTFLRVNKVYVEEIKKRYNVLENYVDCRNKEAITWLKWLGFKLEDPVPYGADQLPFHRFEYRRDARV